MGEIFENVLLLLTSVRDLSMIVSSINFLALSFRLSRSWMSARVLPADCSPCRACAAMSELSFVLGL